MPFSNPDVALALLEAIVLLLPLVALVFQAMVPEKAWIQMETSWWDIRDPRNTMTLISMILVLSLSLVLTYFTANFEPKLSPFLHWAIMLITVATGLIMYLVYRLVVLRQDFTAS